MSRVIQTTKADFAESFLYLNGHRLSLNDYPHLREIYNSEASESVYMFSRQCVYNNQKIFLSTGQNKLAKDLKEGDAILGFDENNLKIIVDSVTNCWDNGIKSVYRIKTRTGKEVYVTDNHPFWKLNNWCEAKDLKEGDLIALSKNNGASLLKNKTVPDCEYKILAFLLAEGGLHGRSIGFTNNNICSSLGEKILVFVLGLSDVIFGCSQISCTIFDIHTCTFSKPHTIRKPITIHLCPLNIQNYKGTFPSFPKILFSKTTQTSWNVNSNTCIYFFLPSFK